MNLAQCHQYEVELFLATIASFVSHCPHPPHREPLNPHKATEDLHLDNETLALRYEIALLSLSLSESRTKLPIPVPVLEDAAEALKGILKLMDDCIDGKHILDQQGVSVVLPTHWSSPCPYHSCKLLDTNGGRTALPQT